MHDPGILPGSADWCILGKVYLRSDLPFKQTVVAREIGNPCNSSTLSTGIRNSGEALLEFRIPVTEVREFRIAVGNLNSGFTSLNSEFRIPVMEVLETRTPNTSNKATYCRGHDAKRWSGIPLIESM